MNIEKLNTSISLEVFPETLWIPLEVVDVNVNYACPNNGGAAGGSTGGAIFFICLAYCGFKNKDKIMNKVKGSVDGISSTVPGVYHKPGGTEFGGGQEMIGENLDIT